MLHHYHLLNLLLLFLLIPLNHKYLKLCRQYFQLQLLRHQRQKNCFQLKLHRHYHLLH